MGAGPLRVIAWGALRGLVFGLALWIAVPALEARDPFPGVIARIMHQKRAQGA